MCSKIMPKRRGSRDLINTLDDSNCQNGSDEGLQYTPLEARSHTEIQGA